MTNYLIRIGPDVKVVDIGDHTLAYSGDEVVVSEEEMRGLLDRINSGQFTLLGPTDEYETGFSPPRSGPAPDIRPSLADAGILRPVRAEPVLARLPVEEVTATIFEVGPQHPMGLAQVIREVSEGTPLEGSLEGLEEDPIPYHVSVSGGQITISGWIVQAMVPLMPCSEWSDTQTVGVRVLSGSGVAGVAFMIYEGYGWGLRLVGSEQAQVVEGQTVQFQLSTDNVAREFLQPDTMMGIGLASETGMTVEVFAGEAQSDLPVIGYEPTPSPDISELSLESVGSLHSVPDADRSGDYKYTRPKDRLEGFFSEINRFFMQATNPQYLPGVDSGVLDLSGSDGHKGINTLIGRTPVMSVTVTEPTRVIMPRAPLHIVIKGAPEKVIWPVPVRGTVTPGVPCTYFVDADTVIATPAPSEVTAPTSVVLTEIPSHPSILAQGGGGKYINKFHLLGRELFVGYGDWTGNHGPIDIVSMNIDTLEWTTHVVGFDTEAVIRFIEHEGALYVPNTDPRLGNIGKIATNKSGSWEILTVGPMIHAFDIAFSGDKMFVCGSMYQDVVVSEWVDDACIYESSDGGATWSLSLRVIAGNRIYRFLPGGDMSGPSVSVRAPDGAGGIYTYSVSGHWSGQGDAGTVTSQWTLAPGSSEFSPSSGEYFPEIETFHGGMSSVPLGSDSPRRHYPRIVPYNPNRCWTPGVGWIGKGLDGPGLMQLESFTDLWGRPAWRWAPGPILPTGVSLGQATVIEGNLYVGTTTGKVYRTADPL